MHIKITIGKLGGKWVKGHIIVFCFLDHSFSDIVSIFLLHLTENKCDVMRVAYRFGKQMRQVVVAIGRTD